MNPIKSFSVKSLIQIISIMIIMAMFFGASGAWIWRLIFSKVPMDVLKNISDQSAEFAFRIKEVLPILHCLEKFFIPVLVGVILFFGLILWLMMRRLFVKLWDGEKSQKQLHRQAPDSLHPQLSKERLKDLPLPEEKEAKNVSAKDSLEINQRLYLHLISVLQRDGRLLDFLAEDLNNYEDHQIGAAVRNIHENCKNIIYKYLKPSAVIDQKEGQEVDIPKNFDINSIKLTGNVGTQPPFHGILRHKGWQVNRLELPLLTPGQNPHILAPAEVEII